MEETLTKECVGCTSTKLEHCDNTMCHRCWVEETTTADDYELED